MDFSVSGIEEWLQNCGNGIIGEMSCIRKCSKSCNRCHHGENIILVANERN